MGPARTAFAWTIFPLGLGLAIAAVMALMERGMAPEQALFGPTLAAYAVVLTLERFLPLHESWKHSRGDLRVDIGHFVVSGMLTIGLLRPFVVAGSVVLAGGLAWYLGMGAVMYWARHIHGGEPEDEIAGLERNLEHWKL